MCVCVCVFETGEEEDSMEVSSTCDIKVWG